MKKLKTAVVGLGMGLSFHIPRIIEHENYELTAICDINKEKLDEICAKYGAAAYTDYNKMIDEAGIDVVVIASPTNLHKDHSVYAMEHGVDVFLEKPMAKTHAEALEIYDVMKKTGRKLMIYQPHRTMSDDLTVQAVMNSGLLGKIYMIKRRSGCFFVRTNWQAYIKNGGGTLFNHGAHYVDELLYLSKGKPEQVSCVLAKVLATGDADDFYKALIRTDNGMILDCEMSMSNAINCVPWEIFGDKGTAVSTVAADGRGCIRVRYFVGDEMVQSQYLKTASVKEDTAEYPWAVKDFYYDDYPRINIYDKIYDYIALDQPSFIPVEETLTVMQTLERCRDAAGVIV